MAEQNEVQTPSQVATPAQPTQVVEQNNAVPDPVMGMDTDILKEMVRANPALSQNKEIAAMLMEVERQAQAQVAPQTKKDEVKPQANVSAPDTTPASEVETTTAPEEVDDAPDPDGSLLLKKPKQVQRLEVKTTEDALAWVSKQYGIKATDLGEAFVKLDKSASKWRKDAELSNERQERLDNIDKGFAEMPKPLYNSINAWSNNEDWDAAFTKSKTSIDYTKPFESQPVELVLKNYFPDDSIEDLDLENIADDPITMRKVQSAKSIYNVEQRAYNQQVQQYLESAESSKKAFNSSVATALDKFNSDFPDMDSKVIKSLESILKGGKEQVLSQFFDNKGLAKPEALTNLFLTKHGKKELDILLNKAVKKAERDTETKLNLDIVSRGNDKPNTGGAAEPAISADLQAHIDSLTSHLKYNSPYAEARPSK